ncbi:MAG: M48 family metallopeptidase [Chloroflexi bacterium]|nr:M48 family metallopeptidase [Chloroflexota bacterium]
MIEHKYSIKDKNGGKVSVLIKRDKRLKKSSRWQRESDGNIHLRIPARLPKKHIKGLLGQIETNLKKQVKTAKRRTDADLQKRAEYVNKKYFKGQIKWHAIRWVGNMNTRLGSCTNGGPTDGHIRISDKIKDWPQWVIDSVIAHELVHRLHNDHSPSFWATLNEGYPLTERARGFTRGLGFAEGKTYEDD